MFQRNVSYFLKLADLRYLVDTLFHIIKYLYENNVSVSIFLDCCGSQPQYFVLNIYVVIIPKPLFFIFVFANVENLFKNLNYSTTHALGRMDNYKMNGE